MRKALPLTSRLLVIVALGAGACGGGGKGSGSYPDGSTSGSGGTTGTAGAGPTAGGHSGTSNGGSGGSVIVFPGSGGTTTPTGGSTGTTATPPAAGSTVLLAGTALLMGPGLTCSSVPATAGATDRWCGVFVPSGNQMVGLLVFNLTKALAGTPITCSTSDVNCVPLNASIDTNSKDTDATYGFFGQTLIYYDATTVYAWRPGWTSGRALMAHSTTSPVQCAGAPNDVTNVICLSGSNNTLYAGSIAASTGGALPMVETLTNGSTGIDFSPDGLSVIYSVKSSSSATSAAETLKMQTIGDATTKKTVASNITAWSISADAAHWYWLSAPTIDANMVTTGALQTAPYPAGTTPAAIQASVGQYLLFGTKGAITLTSSASTSATGADMNVIADVTAPTPALVEGTDVIGLVSVTDAGNILYATTAVQPSTSSNNVLVDLRLIKTDTTGKCAVAPTATADPGATFNTAATAVEWVGVKVDTTGAVTGVSGEYTTIADCASHTFSTALYGYYDATSGLVVQQNYSTTTFIGDIAYAAFGASGVPGTPTTIQGGADATIVPLFPSPGRVLYTLSSGAATDGVYLSPAIATTPDLAPVRRSLATGSANLRPVNTAKLAQSRFAARGQLVPSLIALPGSPSLPASANPALARGALPFARGASGTKVGTTHLFAPLARSLSAR